MARRVSLNGADVKLYIGGTLYRESRNIQYTIDYGEREIYGVDSVFPQEIATTRISVQGRVTGLRIKMSGGIQAYNMRSLIKDVLKAPYVSIEVRDRQTDTKILWVPQAKITNESFSIAAKGVASVSFTFKGIVPYNEMDLA